MIRYYSDQSQASDSPIDGRRLTLKHNVPLVPTNHSNRIVLPNHPISDPTTSHNLSLLLTFDRDREHLQDGRLAIDPGLDDRRQ